MKNNPAGMTGSFQHTVALFWFRMRSEIKSSVFTPGTHKIMSPPFKYLSMASVYTSATLNVKPAAHWRMKFVFQIVINDDVLS